MLKFDEPIPTKSGERVSKIWRELQDCWGLYKKARIDSDLKTMKEYAKRIQILQDDLGITQARFPELEAKSIKNS